MQRRPYVLYVCDRDHQTTLGEAVLARAAFGVLPARTIEDAMGQLSLADAVVICSCWPSERKHSLIDAVRTRSTAPVVCINKDSHACCACTEADRFHPEQLVAGIRSKLFLSGCTRAPENVEHERGIRRP